MQDNEAGNWLIIVWEAVKVLLGLASAAFLWIARNYVADRRAITKNAKDIEGLITEAGKQQAFRTKVDGTPLGEEMKSILKAIGAEHEKLHGRINERREEHQDFKNEIAGRLGKIEGYLEVLVGEHNKKTGK